MAKTALIVGSAGQDGTLLQVSLRRRGYILGCVERTATRIDGSDSDPPVDITCAQQVFELVGRFRPNEIYHLAAVHHSAQQTIADDLKLFRDSYEVNLFSWLAFLEAVRLHSPGTRLFYAASSHVFGHASSEALQNEDTPFRPQSVYAMSKVDGILACRQYRERHGIFASAGILFNHESSLRPDHFLSRRVIKSAVAIKRGASDKLRIGDLKAVVDWGYAPDYVDAMHAILSLEQGDEFVVASAVGHTVQDFVQAAFGEVGLDWEQYVFEDSNQLTNRRQSCIGDSSKLRRVANWRPQTTFSEMIRILIREEMRKPE